MFLTVGIEHLFPRLLHLSFSHPHCCRLLIAYKECKDYVDHEDKTWEYAVYFLSWCKLYKASECKYHKVISKWSIDYHTVEYVPCLQVRIIKVYDVLPHEDVEVELLLFFFMNFNWLPFYTQTIASTHSLDGKNNL